MHVSVEGRWRCVGAVLAALLVCAIAEPAPPPGQVTLAGRHLAIVLDTQDGLGVSRMEARSADGAAVIAEHSRPRRLLQVMLAGDAAETAIDSTAMQVVSAHGSPASGQVLARHERSGLQARLRWSRSGADELELSLALRSPEATEAHLVWPVLEGLLASVAADRVWYFHPRSSGIYSNRPADLASNYGQYVRLQLMGCFAADGLGLYAINKDTDIRRRSFELVKRVPGREADVLHDEYGFQNWGELADIPGVGMAIQSRSVQLASGELHELPPVALGLTRDGIQEAIRRYRGWAESWCCASRTPWFRQAFNYRCVRIFEDAGPEEVLQSLAGDDFDLLHYMVQAEHRNGAYGFREDWGVEALRRLVGELHARGVRSSHYVEGYIAHETTRVYQEHGEQWGQKRGGKNVVAFGNMAMCPSATGWHQWLAEVTTRIVRELDFDVIYLDELGFGTLDKYVCENTHHEHPPRYRGIESTRRLLAHVRGALREVKPGTPLVTEGPAVDQLFTVLDGVQDYGCRDAYHHPEWYSTPIHWVRFAHPDFKFFDIRAGEPQDRAWQLKRILFNGNGFCSHGRGPAPNRPLQDRMTGLYRDHCDAFSAGALTPMLPTRHHGVFANQFGEGRKEIVTVCNTNSYPVAGELLALPHREGAHLMDLWQHRDVPTRRVRDTDMLALELDPRDVTVVGRLPRMVELSQEGIWFDLRAPGHELVLRRVGPGGRVTRHRPLDEGAAVDLVEATEGGRHTVLASALADGIVADERVLPDPRSIDLADFAEVTSSNGDATIRDGMVSWSLKWDEEHPGWVQLTWARPQLIGMCHYRFSRSQYTPRDWSLQRRGEDGEWVTLADKTDGADDHFQPVWTDALRAVVREGGRWANLAALIDWQVRYEPQPAVEDER
ncbi:MAG: DUF6259 domain-containing protein [Armatimonadota bacterium]|nr:DUF6259 domain-containing protein [Armatimonadota bacterium]